MIDIFELEKNVNSGKIDNCYILCGSDENLIKSSVNLIVEKTLNNQNVDFNLSKYDGDKIDFDTLMNACETLPFMSNKKVVVVYRAKFLRDEEKESSKEKLYKELKGYIGSSSDQTVLIFYYVFESSREKPSRRVKELGKRCTFVKIDKLKGMTLQKKVKEIFNSKGKKNIGKSELSIFCNLVDNNMDIINNEIDKLISYTEGRDITKEDIQDMMPVKSENDIFNLVDYLSQKKVKQAVDIYNELVFRGEKSSSILRMIQRQYDLLLNIKLQVGKGKDKDTIAKELRLHPYVCEKMINQSKKFTLRALKNILSMSLETEKRIKSLSTDSNVELEMFMINTLRTK